MDVSKNRGFSKSSILIRFSTVNHPFWGFSMLGDFEVNWLLVEPTPLKNIISSSKWGIFPNFRGENKKRFELPPVRIILLMVGEIWHPPVEVGGLSQYFQGFIHPTGGC